MKTRENRTKNQRGKPPNCKWMPILTSKAFSSYLIKVEKILFFLKVIKSNSVNQVKLELNCKWIYPRCVCVVCVCVSHASSLSLWVQLKHTPNHIPCSSLHSLRVGKARSGVYVCIDFSLLLGCLVLNIKSRDAGVVVVGVVHSQEFSSEKYSKTILFTVCAHRILALALPLCFVCKFYFNIFFLRLMLTFSNYLPIFHFIYFISFKCVSTLCARVSLCVSVCRTVCGFTFVAILYKPNWNWFTDKDLFVNMKGSGVDVCMACVQQL